MNNIKRMLHLKVTLAIVSISILIVSLCVYLTYSHQLKSAELASYEQIRQIVRTVEKPAMIAAYVEDAVLAGEIIDGIMNNNAIAQAILLSKNELVVERYKLSSTAEPISASLAHPFIDDETVGEIIVFPNQVYIHQQAIKNAKTSAITLIIYTSFISISIAFVVHSIVTKPLKILVSTFSKISPENPHSMTIPKRHDQDELGLLISGINKVMSQLQKHMDEEKTLRQQSQELEKHYRLIFEKASAGIGLIDNKHHLMTVNSAFKRLLINGTLSDVPLTQVPFPALFADEDAVTNTIELIKRSRFQQSIALDLQLKPSQHNDSDGEESKWVHCLFSTVSNALEDEAFIIEVLVYDITDRTLKHEATQYEADHDPLTKLYNRRSGERKIETVLHDVQTRKENLVLMMIDLDKFKPINDQYGHEAGDAVLIEISRRLKSFFRDHDICIRWGGDEFLVAFSIAGSDQNILNRRVSQLNRKLSVPISLEDGLEFSIGASIGIAISPLHGNNISDLIQCADQAMYSAKSNGRNQSKVYSTPPSL
ncbi:diguanylate cyclase [Vibrio makurazakiensis]|uniref:diguanylate cyclase domain-containing protein n=1 Tax=Vibrio makurazakiensis TaxID=2910250 RepID=UPI003D0D7119